MEGDVNGVRLERWTDLVEGDVNGVRLERWTDPVEGDVMELDWKGGLIVWKVT